MTPPGKRRHLITIMAETVTGRSGTGAVEQKFQDVRPNQFAEVKVIGANEQEKATGQVMVGRYAVNMLYRTDVTFKNRFRWEDTGIILQITGITPHPEIGEIDFACSSLST